MSAAPSYPQQYSQPQQPQAQPWNQAPPPQWNNAPPQAQQAQQPQQPWSPPAQQPAPTMPQAFQPQAGPGSDIQQAAQTLASGQFPYLNQSEMIGQIQPNNLMPNGFQMTSRPNNNGGAMQVLDINLVAINIYTDRQGTTKEIHESVSVSCFGRTAESLVQQLQVGMWVKVTGKLKVQRYQKKNTNPPQWQTSVRIQIDNTRDGAPPLVPIGVGPVRPRPAQAPQGGYQQAPQNYQQAPQGYQHSPQAAPLQQPPQGYQQGAPVQAPQQWGQQPQGQPAQWTPPQSQPQQPQQQWGGPPQNAQPPQQPQQWAAQPPASPQAPQQPQPAQGGPPAWQAGSPVGFPVASEDIPF